MWWAAGINKVSVPELAVCYMVLRRAARAVLLVAAAQAASGRARSASAPTCAAAPSASTAAGIIGKEVVKLLQPYGVKILACDRVDYSDFYREWSVEKVEADELWARSDVLTIHLSRNATTIGMYNGKVLDKMKTGAILINCARGNIVDEPRSSSGSRAVIIAGAAFDVFAVEPANGNPLLELPTFFGSPHIGATTLESWEAMLRSGMHGIEHAYVRSRASTRSIDEAEEMIA